MTLVYIFSGHYAGFKNVLRLAETRSKSSIVVVDQPETYASWNRAVSLPAYKAAPWEATQVARWFVLREMIQRRTLSLPVFCSDWDVLIFSPLEKAYAPFATFDYSVSIDQGISSAAYCVSNMAALDAFYDLIMGLYSDQRKAPPALNDMAAWTGVSSTGRFRVGNLFNIVNDSVFDHNIVCGADRFQMDNGMKEIRWVDESPYFVALDGKLIKANTIHCWGPLKAKTGSLIKKAGLE